MSRSLSSCLLLLGLGTALSTVPQHISPTPIKDPTFYSEHPTLPSRRTDNICSNTREPAELSHHLFLANLCWQSELRPGNLLCIRWPQHWWAQTESTRSRLWISKLKTNKNNSQGNIYSNWRKKPCKKRLQPSHFLPRESLECCQKMLL